jgi:hypothetical protein
MGVISNIVNSRVATATQLGQALAAAAGESNVGSAQGQAAVLDTLVNRAAMNMYCAGTDIGSQATVPNQFNGYTRNPAQTQAIIAAVEQAAQTGVDPTTGAAARNDPAANSGLAAIGGAPSQAPVGLLGSGWGNPDVRPGERTDPDNHKYIFLRQRPVGWLVLRSPVV